MRYAVIALSIAIAAAQPASACVSRVAPVLVDVGGTTVDLLQAKEGNLLSGVTVVRIAPTTTDGWESKATLITLRRFGEEQTFRLAYPPLMRGTGCNQPSAKKLS
jgi:hypothetical protein